MEVVDRGQAEGALEEDLARGRLEQVGAADDFGDGHGGVVHHAGELVAGQAAGVGVDGDWLAPDQEIGKVRTRSEGLRAEVGIGEAHDLAVGDAEAVVGGGIEGWRGCGVRGAAATVVERLIVLVVRGVQTAGEIAARAGAGVDGAGLEELVECGAVQRETLRLRDHRGLPGDAEPGKVFQHGVDELGPGPLWVEVFVAEKEGAAGVTGAGVGGPEGGGVAQVQKAGRRWSEAADVGHESMITLVPRPPSFRGVGSPGDERPGWNF